MDGTAIPLTAWQQGGMVVLFAVIIFVMLRHFAGQQRDWQNFISDRDRQWQAWMGSTETRTCEQLAKVTTALDRLAEKIDAHDDRVEDRIVRAEAAAISAATPRKTVPRKPGGA